MNSKHIGSTFGQLTVTGVHEVHRTAKGGYVQIMQTRCTCGAERQTAITNLTSGNIKACKDCAKPFRNTVTIKHPLYRRYRAMRERCYNPNNDSYKYYGGKGITVCDRWMASGMEGFANFVADMGECPTDFTLDRKDGSKNYEPNNCRWVDIVTQNKNRTYKISVV